MSMGFSVFAHAKVNITLRVLGRRSNGYHDLFMIMVPLSLADDLELHPLPHGIELYFDGMDENLPPEKNLAWRAAKMFQEVSGISKGVRIHVKKNIPVAAGLGGGSSDAAAVLRGLNKLW